MTAAAFGKLITLEGVDGAGKSTHVQFIADTLRAEARKVIVTREPGGTNLAEQLRDTLLLKPMDPLTETLLMFAARADHVSRIIRPALEAGTWVICDRFTDATFAYQGAGKGVNADHIRRLAELVHPGLKPDRTLVFDCDFEVSRQRLKSSGKTLDRFESEEGAFFERVRRAYLDAAKAEPERVRVINAAADMKTIREAISRGLYGL
ncbi:MAG TPA: dTMP kinase [Burkholderiales bacterium]